MDKAITTGIAIFTGLAAIAIVAVIVSKKSDTANVLQSLFGGYAIALKEAVSPVVAGG